MMSKSVHGVEAGGSRSATFAFLAKGIVFRYTCTGCKQAM